MSEFTVQRELYINARSLILKALDLMDKAYNVGKYKPSREVAIGAGDSIASAVTTTLTEVKVEQKDTQQL